MNNSKMISRRFFTLITLAGFFPAYAKSHKAQFTHRGKEITIFSDGVFSIPTAMALPDKTPAEIEAIFKAHPQGALKAGELNVVLIKTGNELVLIDCGSSTNFTPTLGLLTKHLEEAGIALDSITKVILTHAHPDHLWGALDEFNEPTFPKATYIISQIERDFWLAPDRVALASDAMKGITAGTVRILKTLGEKLITANDQASVAKDITYQSSFGHTAGHMCVRVDHDLMIVGDVLTNHVLSFAHPTMPIGSDMDREMGIKTRSRLLDQVLQDKIKIIGYHLPQSGVGYIEKRANAYQFVQ